MTASEKAIYDKNALNTIKSNKEIDGTQPCIIGLVWLFKFACDPHPIYPNQCYKMFEA